MNRIVFFVDGFNHYHALDSCRKYHKYKWLNLSKLAKCFVKKNERIDGVYYFTALSTWSKSKREKHEKLIKALELEKVKVVYGKFRRRDKACPLCKKTYQTFEEKQTDVNMAIHLLRLAIEDQYDTAIIMSGDSDLVPSIEATKNIFPTKRIGVVIPIGRRAELLKNVCDFHFKLKERQLKSSLFNKEIDLGDSKKIVCPAGWQ